MSRGSADRSAPAPTTEMLLAVRGLGRSLQPYLGAWACSLLEDGVDTPHVRMAAAAGANESPFELDALFDRAAADLGLRLYTSREAAAVGFACERSRLYLADRLSQEVLLEDICALCTELDYLDALFGFCETKWMQEDADVLGLSEASIGRMLREAIDRVQASGAE